MSGKGSWRWRGDAAELRYQFAGKTKTATLRGADGKRPKIGDIDLKLRELMTAVDKNHHANAPAKITVANWSEDWLDLIRSEVAPRTLKIYGNNVRQHIIPAIGHIRLAHLDRAAISRLRAGLAGKLARNSRRSVQTVLVACLGRAVQDGLLSVNPASGFTSKAPKGEKAAKPHIITLEQSRALLDAAKADTRLYPAIFVALATGMRRGEVLALRWGNVDLDAGVITVSEGLTEERTISTTKSGQEREVAIAEPVVEELRRIKKAQAEGLLQLGIRQTKETRVCTRGADGFVYCLTALSQAFRMLLKRYRLPHCRFHDLRHFFASRLIEAGVSVRVAAEILGHQDGGALLLRVYAHGDENQHKEAAKRVGALFS